MPTSTALDDYIVYIGFDPMSASRSLNAPRRKRAPSQSRTASPRTEPVPPEIGDYGSSTNADETVIGVRALS